MTPIWRISLLFFIACITGSSRAEEPEVDTRQSPAADARWLTLIVQAENDIAPQPVSLEYQAGQCTESRSYGVGGQSQSGRMQMPALHFEKITLSKQTSSQRYQARIALDAGGSCQWKLVGLSTQFKYTSQHAQTKGQELLSQRIKIAFADRKNAVRKLDVLMRFQYFPVIYLADNPAQNSIKLQSGGFPDLPSFDPAESGTLMLQFKVFNDLAMTARVDPQNPYLYLTTYPDGATGATTSAGVMDERMICLMQTRAAGSTDLQRCNRYAPVNDKR
ncbi:MAG: hypothetical protein LBE30_15965 [Comamonas sp.]|jgi:hypothetical protein|nr:hypothetical protein [Comamonas sp.]